MELKKSRQAFELSSNQKALFEYCRDAGMFYHQVSLQLPARWTPQQIIDTANHLVRDHEVLFYALLQDKESKFPNQTQLDSAEAAYLVVDANKTKVKNNKSAGFEFLTSAYDSYSDHPLRILLQTGKKQHAVHIRVFALWADSFTAVYIAGELVNRLKGKYDRMLPENVISYKNFSKWQNELESENDADAEKFWDAYRNLPFKDILPFEVSSAAEFTPGRIPVYSFTGDELDLLEAKATSFCCKVEDLLLAVCVRYFARFATNSFLVGFRPFKRGYEELDNTLGLVSKTVPIKIQVPASNSLKELIALLMEEKKEVLHWSDNFFFKRDLMLRAADKPFFNCVIEHIDAAESGCAPLCEMITAIESVPDSTALIFQSVSYHDRLDIHLQYNSGIYTQEVINIISGQLQSEIESVLSEQEGGRLLTQAELRILQQANRTDVKISSCETILDLFHVQVDRVPGNVAVIFGNKSLTYQELGSQSDRLAYLLIQQYKIHPGDVVAVALGRSLAVMTCILGILKAGAAYVPIDISSNPAERIYYILEDSGAVLLVTDGSTKKIFAEDCELPVFDVSDQWNQLLVVDEKSLELKPVPGGNSLAYIIYTSGSSGEPKGCMMSHHNLLNYISWE